MRKLTLLVAVFFMLFAGPALVLSQSQSAEANEWLAEAQQQYADGHVEEAKEAFEKALKKDKDLIPAYIGLGRLAIDVEKWDDASDNFGKVLDRDPDNLDANYYRGIAYREIGKTRPKFANNIPLMNKLLEYQKSEKNFEHVLSQDSLFSDVLYQYALLQRYRDKYHQAIWLAQRQLELKPDLLAAQIGMLRIYRHYIVSQSEDNAIEWLQRQPWQQAAFFVGEKLRRSHQFVAADSVYLAMLNEPLKMPIQPILLALAKSAFSQDKPRVGENYYWNAVEHIQNDIDAEFVFEEAKYIFSDEDLSNFRSLTNIDDKKAFFRIFWASRDPLPASQTNVRLAEHYRRFVFAEDNYEYTGFKSWANNADKLQYLEFPQAYDLNEEFNDKGLVYLRHGPPDDKVVTVNPNVPSNESWKYWQSGRNQEMTFHFLYDENASGNLWTLTPILREPEMVRDRATWDLAYQKMMSYTSPADQFRFEDEIIYSSKKSVETGFETDRHTWKDKVVPLDVPISLATFRGPQGKTRFEIYYGIPLDEIAKALPDSEMVAVVEKGLAVHDPNWKLLGKLTQKVNIPIHQQNQGDMRTYIDLFQTDLDPKQYRVGFHLKPQGTSLLSGFSDYQIKIPDYSKNELAISDIELAANIEPATKLGLFTKNDLLVVPNPSKSYSRKNPVFIYFEIYNLKLDANGETAFSVEYIVSRLDDKDKSFDRRKSDRSSVSLNTDRQGNSSFSPEFLSIDVNKLKKGQVLLSVRITDKKSKQAAIRDSQFVLYE